MALLEIEFKITERVSTMYVETLLILLTINLPGVYKK
jgi:hypothetical protein